MSPNITKYLIGISGVLGGAVLFGLFLFGRRLLIRQKDRKQEAIDELKNELESINQQLNRSVADRKSLEQENERLLQEKNKCEDENISLKEEAKFQIGQIAEYKHIYDMMQSREKENLSKIDRLKIEINALNVRLQEEQQHSSRHFVVENLMTAGPRKDAGPDVNDIDLGEDCCGSLIIDSTLYFWLMDGTGGEDILTDENGRQLFSPRILAQTLAINLSKKAVGGKPNDVKIWCETALKDTVAEIENLANDNNLIRYFDSSGIKTSKCTLVAGIWNKESGEMWAIRKGDSGILLIDDKNKIINSRLSNTEERSNVVVQLKNKINNRLTASVFDFSTVLVSEKIPSVASFFAYSDGVASRIRKNIAGIINEFASTDANYNIVRTFLHRERQGTKDDKSLISGHITD
jgi:hypothetical protein